MTDKIRTVIVDDEQSSILTLMKLLQRHCPEVQIIDTAESVEEGIECINRQKPELVFLDINMPDGEGFDILEAVSHKNFEVIMVTAYDHYAIRAFDISALHYLLKPIKDKDLLDAMERYKQSAPENNMLEDKVKVLNDHLNAQARKVILPCSDGFTVVELDEIVRCQSSNNYTTFYVNGGKEIVVSKPINVYESMLSDMDFVRIHSKHLVNLMYVKKYVKGRGGYVVLHDDTEVDVSEGKRKDFLLHMTAYARG